MDPNATLARIRELADENSRRDLRREETDELTDQLGALDEWLSQGGFLPAAWDVS